MTSVSSRFNAAISYIATCLFWCSFYVYVPILSTYVESMGASYTMIGIILSSYGLIQLIIRIPIGVLSDKFNKRRIFMLFGLVVSVVSGIVFYLGKTPLAMLIGRSLGGVSAATWAVFMVNYGSFYPADMQSKSMGVIGTTSFVGQVVATFCGGVIALLFSERLTFLISSIVGLFGILLVVIVPEHMVVYKEPLKLKDFLNLLKDRDLLYFSMLAVVMQIAAYTGVMGFVPNILRDLGGSSYILGLSNAFASLLSIPTSLLSGSFFEEKIGFKISLTVSFAAIAVMLVLMGLSTNIPLILILVLINSAPRGLLQPMLNSLAIRSIKPQLRSSAAAVFQSIYGLGMTIGPAVAGMLADSYGMTFAFIAVGIFTLAAFFVVLFRKTWPDWVN